MPATNDPTGRSPSGNPSILSRDQDGAERWLHVVDHPASMISIADDAMVRVMHPAAALELGILLIQATRGHFRGIVGPISGGY